MRTENFRISMVTGNGNAGDNTNNGASSGARISPMLGPSQNAKEQPQLSFNSTVSKDAETNRSGMTSRNIPNGN